MANWCFMEVRNFVNQIIMDSYFSLVEWFDGHYWLNDNGEIVKTDKPSKTYLLTILAMGTLVSLF